MVTSPTEDAARLALAGPRPGEVGQGAVEVEAGDEQLGRGERCPTSGDEETWPGGERREDLPDLPEGQTSVYWTLKKTGVVSSPGLGRRRSGMQSRCVGRSPAVSIELVHSPCPADDTSCSSQSEDRSRRSASCSESRRPRRPPGGWRGRSGQRSGRRGRRSWRGSAQASTLTFGLT